MAEEAGGLPFRATNPQGRGAVYFDKTIEPLQNLNYNLRQLSNDDDFWKAWKLKELQDQKKAKLAEDITKDLNFNYNGAMPEDVVNEFIPAYQDISNQYAKIVSQYGGNMSALTKSPEYQRLRGNMNLLKGRVATSVEHNKIFTDNAKNYTTNPDKYDDESLSNIALGRTKNLDERNKYISERGGTFLKAKQPDLEKELQESLTNFAPHIYNVQENSFEKGGQVWQEKVSTVDDNKLLANSKAFVLNKSGDVDAKWNNMSPADQAHYADAANILSQATGKNIDPKTYYIYDWYKNKLGQKQELQGGAITPERTEAAKEKQEQLNANALYKLVNATVELNPEVYAKGIDGNRVMVDGKYVSTDMGGLIIGTRQIAYTPTDNLGKPQKDVNGKPIVLTNTAPDRIIAVRVDPNNPNIFEIRTDEDVASDPTGKNFSKKMTRDELAYSIAISNFKDAATGLNRFKKAAEEFKDVTKAGVIIPTQTINAPLTINKNWRTTSTYTPSGLTQSGVPTGKKEENKVAPIKLTGKINPATLEVGKQYEVDGVVYTWNGTNLE